MLWDNQYAWMQSADFSVKQNIYSQNMMNIRITLYYQRLVRQLIYFTVTRPSFTTDVVG